MTGARLLDPPGQCNGVRSQFPAWTVNDAHADGRTESFPSWRGNRGETRPRQTGVVTGTQELTRDEWAETASRSFVPLAVSRVAHSFSGKIERRAIGPGLSISRVCLNSGTGDDHPLLHQNLQIPTPGVGEETLLGFQTLNHDGNFRAER